MRDNGRLWRCDQFIASEINAGRAVLEELLRQLQSQGWPQRDLFGVHLAMEEALVNAIRHGNRSDPRKRVHIVCELFGDRVRIEVSDEGEGFDPRAVPDPTDPARLQIPSGRGLTLIRSFMSKVEFRDSGRWLILEKCREGAAHCTAAG
jgi:serine/threonine-protein kinase RsbW